MKKLSLTKLADTVITKRKTMSLTQQQLSDSTNINRATISRIEAADFTPSIPQLEQLSQVLNFDLTELFTDSSLNNQFQSVSPLKIAVAGTGNLTSTT